MNRSRLASSHEPWSSATTRLAIATQGVCALAILVAAASAAGRDLLTDQIGPLNAAVCALVLSAAFNAWWLLTARRSIGARTLALTAAFDRSPSPAPPVDDVPANGWVWLPGTTRAHRPGCAFVVDKPVVAIETRAIRDQMLQRCEVC